MSTTAKNSLTAQNKDTTVVEKKPKTIFDIIQAGANNLQQHYQSTLIAKDS